MSTTIDRLELFERSIEQIKRLHRDEVERAATSARLDGKIEAYIEINDQWPDLMVGREWFDNQLETYIDRSAMGAVK